LTEISRAEGRRLRDGVGVAAQAVRLRKLVAGQRQLRVRREREAISKRCELEAKRAALVER